MDEEQPWPELEIRIPPESPTNIELTTCVLEPATAYDRRLKGYQLQLTLSPPTPDDPHPWPVWQFSPDPQSPPTHTWRLWLMSLRYDHAPIIGTLHYESANDWQERTYARPEATPADYTQLAYGLQVLKQRAPRPGRTPGTGYYPTRDQFQSDLITTARALTQVQGRPTQEHVARHLPWRISTRHLQTLLKTHGIDWRTDVLREALRQP
jgi:hypothetical protein